MVSFRDDYEQAVLERVIMDEAKNSAVKAKNQALRDSTVWTYKYGLSGSWAPVGALVRDVQKIKPPAPTLFSDFWN
jgi:hypothetical protein